LLNLKINSITYRLILLILIIAIVPLLVVPKILFENARNELQDITIEKLSIISSERIKTIEMVVENFVTDTNTVKEYYNVKINLPILIQHQDDLNNKNLLTSKDMLDLQLSKQVFSNNLLNNIILTDSNGSVVYSINNDNLGTNIKSYFDFSSKSDISFSKLIENSNGKYDILIASSVHDFNDNKIGYAVLDYDVPNILASASNIAGLENTEEALISQQPGEMIQIFSTNPKLTLDLSNNLFLNSGVYMTDDFGIIEDRSESTFAVWRQIPVLNWTYIIQVDTNEAFKAIGDLEAYSLSVIMFVGLIATISAIIISKSYLSPIIHLNNATKQVQQGSLKLELNTTRNDEIGNLSRSFVSMYDTIQQKDEITKSYQKKLEQKNSELKKVLEEIRLIEKMKEEFSSMISHELKTPLTPILGYCEILQEQGDMGKLTQKQLDAIKIVENNANQLKNLVNDLLDAHKIDMKKMNFHETTFSVSKFMIKICENIKPILQEKQIKLINNTAKFNLYSDEERLQQVINNLIHNAIDFVPKNGRIEIGADIENGSSKFYVKDNGLGIRKEKQANLFQKFYQIDTSTTRKHGGTGLGLVVCKGIIEGLSGKIWVESDVGKGATFFFTVPLKTTVLENRTQQK